MYYYYRIQSMERIAESELIINGDGTIFHLHLKPEDIADADLLSMEFSLYDFEDFELSGAGMNVPIE